MSSRSHPRAAECVALPVLRSLLIVVLAGAFGCGAPVEAPAVEAPPPPEVSIVTVAPRSLLVEDVLPGRVVPVRVAEVRPLVSGIVRARLFTEGDTVVAGQPLYRVDPTVFRAEVAGASATTARQRAALATAEREAERMRRLAERGVASEQALHNAESALELARAELAMSEATLARSRISLRYATVTAPIAGRIGLSRVTEGALVGSADPQPMVTIQQLDQVYVDIRQPASRYEELRERLARGELERSEGLPVRLLSTRGEPYGVEGRLLSTDVNVDPTTSELTLRVLVPNPDLLLLPGMFVRARIAFGREPAAITVPQQAVLHDPALGESVLVVAEGDVVAARRVTVGRVVDGHYIVREGLAAGDRVIVEGQDRLAPGTPVRPVPWDVMLEVGAADAPVASGAPAEPAAPTTTTTVRPEIASE